MPQTPSTDASFFSEIHGWGRVDFGKTAYFRKLLAG